MTTINTEEKMQVTHIAMPNSNIQTMAFDSHIDMALFNVRKISMSRPHMIKTDDSKSTCRTVWIHMTDGSTVELAMFSPIMPKVSKV